MPVSEVGSIKLAENEIAHSNDVVMQAEQIHSKIVEADKQKVVLADDDELSNIFPRPAQQNHQHQQK